MPLTPSFTAAQSALSPSEVLFTDTSSGSDVAVVSRRAFVQTSVGSYLVPSGTSTDYSVWVYADSTILLDILATDQACAVTVQWLDVSNNILYTLTQLYCFPQNNKNFFYYLIQQQAMSPSILQDSNYFSNMATYWMNIVGAVNAVEIGADIAASQNCLNRATAMMENQNFNF